MMSFVGQMLQTKDQIKSLVNVMMKLVALIGGLAHGSRVLLLVND
jgi:hypothetical protein